MASLLVVNASPIIALARAGLVEPVLGDGGRVIVPLAVRHEVLAGPPDDPGRCLLTEPWGQPGPEPPIDPAVWEWGLGPGESAVIAAVLAMPHAEAVLDDRRARACAAAFGLRRVGTLAQGLSTNTSTTSASKLGDPDGR